MIHPRELNGHENGRIKEFPHNTVTLEHTRSRVDPGRGKGGYVNTLLCWKCNNEKGDQDLKAFLTIEEIRDRGKSKSGRTLQKCEIPQSSICDAVLLEMWLVKEANKRLRYQDSAENLISKVNHGAQATAFKQCISFLRNHRTQNHENE